MVTTTVHQDAGRPPEQGRRRPGRHVEGRPAESRPAESRPAESAADSPGTRDAQNDITMAERRPADVTVAERRPADVVLAERPRPAPLGVVRQLLRSAVALEAEDLLRTIGALAVASHRSEGTAAAVDWIGWVERDVRDLGRLARAALEVGATLPAGLDVGGGDPARPETVIEGLLAGHDEVLRVLRDLDAVGGDEPWNEVVARILARREAEATALRVSVGPDSPREREVTHIGRSPDRHFTPDLLV